MNQVPFFPNKKAGTTGHVAIFAILLLAASFMGNHSATAMAPDEDEVYRVVEEMPEIIGGIQELYKHLQYPERAVRGGVEGRVVVQFIIDENGEIHNPEILRDIGAGCGDAAVEAIKSVRFSPGRQNGQAVAVLYALPITFQIQ
ncbi:energy transducer TonB [Balneolales bacterium ANBcel1]|nr:energy transducer TonB [Balneolales bacterium ANBcel1]